MAKLAVEIAGIKLKNPVIAASGTFGSGREYSAFTDPSALGAIIPKSITLVARSGNPVPRICETPAGMLNSIGLENKGLQAFIQEDLPYLKSIKTPVIISIAGETVEEFKETISRLNECSGLAGIELNVSCPNIDKGGVHFGCDPYIAADVTNKVKAISKYPVIVKLTPNVNDIAAIAIAVEEAGADAISLINTILGMAIDIRTRRPRLGKTYGGLSGPAIKPVAVKMVFDVARAVSIPVIGMGGISSAQDAIELIMAGASAVQVGTANFIDPMVMAKIVDGIDRFLEEEGYEDIREIIGKVEM